MTDITHSQGPWSVQENAYGKVFIYGGKTLVAPTGFEYQELIAGGNSHDTLTLANAQFMVLACNAYYDQIAQIDRLQTSVRHWREECGKLNSQIGRLKDTIQWCLARDEQNGYLPEAYAEKLASVMTGGSNG